MSDLADIPQGNSPSCAEADTGGTFVDSEAPASAASTIPVSDALPPAAETAANVPASKGSVVRFEEDADDGQQSGLDSHTGSEEEFAGYDDEDGAKADDERDDDDMGGYGSIIRASLTSIDDKERPLLNPSEEEISTRFALNSSVPESSQSKFLSSSRRPRGLSLLQLMCIVYFSVGGGPFGFEQSLRAALPAVCFWTLLVLSLLWALPQALYVAELSTRYKRGYNEWVTTALGPTIGMAHSVLRTFFGIATNGVYLSLFVEYAVPFIKSWLPIVDSSNDSYYSSSIPSMSPPPDSSVWNNFYLDWEKGVSIAVYTVIVLAVNLAGVQLVGAASVILAVLVLTPFVIMFALGIKLLNFKMLITFPPKGEFFNSTDLSLLISVMVFNLQGWDFVGNLSSKARKPQRDVPGSILGALALLFLTYFIPTFVSASVLGVDGAQDSDNLYVDAASLLWSVLPILVTVSALLGVLGLGCSFLTTSSEALAHSTFFLYAPSIFAKRTSRGDVPIISIISQTILLVILGIIFEFSILVQIQMFLLCVSTVVIGISYIVIKAREKKNLFITPTSHRVFVLKNRHFGAFLLPVTCIALSIFGIAMSDWQTWLISGVTTILSVVISFVWSVLMPRNAKLDFSIFKKLCGGLILLPRHKIK